MTSMEERINHAVTLVGELKDNLEKAAGAAADDSREGWRGYLNRIGKLERSLIEKTRTITQLEKAVAGKNDVIAGLETAVHGKNDRIGELEKKLAEKTRTITQLEEAVGRKNARVADLEDGNRKLTAASAGVVEVRDELRAEKEKLTAENKALREELDTARLSRDEGREHWYALAQASKAEESRLRDRVDELEDVVNWNVDAINRGQSHIKELDRRIEDYENTVSELRGWLADRTRERNAAEADRDRWKKRASEAEAEANSIGMERDELAKKLKSVTKELDDFTRIVRGAL